MSDSTKAVATTGVAATRGSFPYLAILSLIFVIAKLFGHFPHSWWIVFLPMYIIPVSFITIVLTLLVVGGLFLGLAFIAAAVIDYKSAQRKKRSTSTYNL